MLFEEREFGVVLLDVDLKCVTADEIAEIKERLYRHRAVIIKHQQLTPSELCEASHRFGTPEPYLQSNYHHPEHPLIFVSSNVKRDGKPMGVARTGGYWHSDTSFQESPIPLTMLMPRIIPQNYKRRTDFIDLSEVFIELPANLKSQLANAYAIHSGRWRYKIRTDDAGLDLVELLSLIDRTVAPSYHPAVITHPVTQEQILYVSSGFTIGIADAKHQKIDGLRKQVTKFAESGAFTKSVTWDEGDVILWDNRFLLHKSGRFESPTGDVLEQVEKEEETMMFRIIIRDEFPLSL